MTEDIRAGKPSASRWNISEACFGYENLKRSIPDLENVIELPDEMAQRGIRIHKAWETGDTNALAEDELEDYTLSLEHAKKSFSEWKNWLKDTLPVIEKRELRLWYSDPDTLEPLLSGQPDRIYIAGDYALAQDLKSGWVRRLIPSERNSQLRLLAFLVWKNYGTHNIRVSFIKPKDHKNPIDATDYTEADLIRVEQQVLHTLWMSKQPDAQRIPGSHCYYCECRSFCRESAAYSLVPAVLGENPVEAVQYLNPAELKIIWQKSSVIKNVLKAVDDRLKQMTDEQRAEIGLTIGQGRKLDSIVDTAGAYRVLYELLEIGNETNPDGAKLAAELWQCMEFQKGKLTELVKDAKGLSKAKSESLLYKDLLDPCIKRERSKGSLEEM